QLTRTATADNPTMTIATSALVERMRSATRNAPVGSAGGRRGGRGRKGSWVGTRRESAACKFKNSRHHSLIAWQRAVDLFIKLHLLTLNQFPALEKFELGSQLRKAAYSVAANIVEGFGRRSGKSRLNFLNIAEGSLAEAGYCVHVAHRL